LARTVATSSWAIARRVASAQYLHRAVVGLQRIVESQLVIAEAERFAARVRLAHVLCERDQLLDHLRCLDRAVLVAADRLLEHLSERPRLHDVLAPTAAHLAGQQLAQQLHGQVALR
jgi:hypothetical protein